MPHALVVAVRSALWLAVFAIAAGSPARPAVAGDASGAQRAAADCALVSVDEAREVFGAPVRSADAAAMRGGSCLFAARDVSDDGFVRYAIVRDADLPRVRRFFALNARLCGNVAANAPRAALCASFRRLAGSDSVTAYCDARADLPGARALDGIGESASVAGEEVFVRRGEACLETVVRRDAAFDEARSERLARLLVPRLDAALRDEDPPPDPTTPRA